MERKISDFRRGLAAGFPIGLGYLSVSFTFGIIVVKLGFDWWIGVLISLTNLTSAGQLAGIEVIAMSGTIVEMILTQLVINIRYSLMSISLSQKADESVTTPKRFLLGFGITDEIFAVAMSSGPSFSANYLAGLLVLPIIGWTTGTLLGTISGTLLPQDAINALSIAIYAMFIAIIVPPMRQNRKIIVVVSLAALFSLALRYVPILNLFPSRYATITSAILAAAVSAILFPADDSASTDDSTSTNDSASNNDSKSNTKEAANG